jgi:hypothetical protein
MGLIPTPGSTAGSDWKIFRGSGREPPRVEWADSSDESDATGMETPDKNRRGRTAPVTGQDN